ncbi:MAG: autotransporter-associated beta strand repeat-containing protein, partial [Puniceicoccales bacterium]|nr:autotransporter-associated beta strand repeat-containing protein [Puniceicoccales bacterium]
GNWDLYDSTGASVLSVAALANNVGLIFDGTGINDRTTIQGGILDTGDSAGYYSYAIFARNAGGAGAASTLILKPDKLIGSGNIAAWCNNAEENLYNRGTGGIQLATDASEWGGYFFVARFDRNSSIGAADVPLTSIGPNATIEFSSASAGEVSYVYFRGNTDLAAKLGAQGDGGDNDAGFSIVAGAGNVVYAHAPNENTNRRIIRIDSGTYAVASNYDMGSYIAINTADAALQFVTPNGSYTGKLWLVNNTDVIKTIRVSRAAEFINGVWTEYGDPITVTYSGSIGDNSPLRKTGEGTLILTAKPATTGKPLYVAGGTLKLSGAGATWSPGSIVLENNSTLHFEDPSSAATISAVISGSGSVLISEPAQNDTNSNTLVLSGANTYTGTTEIFHGRMQITNISAFGKSTVYLHDSGQAMINVAGTFANDLVISGYGFNDGSTTHGHAGAIRVSKDGVILSGSITLTGDAGIGGDSGATISGNLISPAGYTLSFGPNDAGPLGNATFKGKTWTLTGANLDFHGSIELATISYNNLTLGSATGRASLPYAAGITVGSGSTLTINNAAASYPTAALAAEAAGATGYDLLAAKYDIIAADITGAGAVTRSTKGGVVYYIGDASGHTHASGFNITAGIIVLGLPEGASEAAAGITPKINTVNVGGSNGATLGTEGGYITNLTVANYGIIKILNAVKAADAVAGEDYTVVTNLTKSGILQFDVTDFLAAHPDGGTYPVFQVTGTGKPAAGALTSNWQIEAAAGTIRPGTITFAADAAGVVSLVVAAPPTLNLTYIATASGGNTTWTVAGTTNFKNSADGTAQQFYNGDTVTFDNTAGTGSKTVTISDTVKPAAIFVDTPATTDTYIFSGGVIADLAAASPTSITKTGAGRLQIPNGYTFSGGVTLADNGGTLAIDGTWGTGVLTMGDNTTLMLRHNNVSASYRIFIDGGDTATVSGEGQSGRNFAPTLLGTGTLVVNDVAFCSVGDGQFAGTIVSGIATKRKIQLPAGDWSQATLKLLANTFVENGSYNSGYSFESNASGSGVTKIKEVIFEGGGYIYPGWGSGSGTATWDIGKVTREAGSDNSIAVLGGSAANIVGQYASSFLDTNPASETYGKRTLVIDNQDTDAVIWLSRPVVDSTAGATTLVKEGPGLLILQNAASTFTGGMVINEGEVRANAATTNAASTSVFGSRTTGGDIIINSGAILTFTKQDVYGIDTYVTTYNQKFIVNEGGVIRNGHDYGNLLTTPAGMFLYDIVLNGGDMALRPGSTNTSTGGNFVSPTGGWVGWGSLILASSVSVPDGKSSKIRYDDGVSASESTFLRIDGKAGLNFTFDIGTGATLDVSVPVADGCNPGNDKIADAIVKTGSGLLSFSNTVSFTNALTVSAGTAEFAGTLGNSVTLSAVNIAANANLAFNKDIADGFTTAAPFTFNRPISGAGNIRSTGTGAAKPTDITASFTGGVFADSGTLDLTGVTSGGWNGTVSKFGVGDAGTLAIAASGFGVSVTSNQTSYAGHTPSVSRTDITGGLTLANTQKLYIGGDGSAQNTAVTTDAPDIALLTIEGALNLGDTRLYFDVNSAGTASDSILITGATAALTVSTATPLNFNGTGSDGYFPTGEYRIIGAPASSAAASAITTALTSGLFRIGEINGELYEPDAEDADPLAPKLSLDSITDNGVTYLVLSAAPAAAIVYWNQNGTGADGTAGGVSALVKGAGDAGKIWYSEAQQRHFGASDGFTYVFDANKVNPDAATPGTKYPAAPSTVPVESAVAALGVRLNTGALTLENVTTSSGGGALTAFARGTVFDVGRKNYTDHDSNP